MKTFLLTSEKWPGEIELRYGNDELLVGLDIRAELTDEQKRWFLWNMPRSLAGINEFVNLTATGKLTPLPDMEITFERFWERYNDKINSSKKKTRRVWDAMPKSEQTKAFFYISKYIASLPHGTRKKYAETYLNAELWNN